jgi:DNA-binding MurR/RpiR family transcriptional regulator
LRRVPTKGFDVAAAILADAKYLRWRGTSPPAHLADCTAFLSRQLVRPAGSLTHAGTHHADELLALASDDAVAVLAYGRIRPYVHVLLQHAADVNAKVVLITDMINVRSTSPIAAQLNGGRGAPGLFATHGPTIVLLEGTRTRHRGC